MSNIFISYRFTGENLVQLEYILGGMRKSLQIAGHSVICSFYNEDFFKKNCFTASQIYDYMLERQKESDVFIALVKTLDRSNGMLMESEMAIKLNQRYVLAIKDGLYIKEFNEAADEIINYRDFEGLFKTLANFK